MRRYALYRVPILVFLLIRRKKAVRRCHLQAHRRFHLYLLYFFSPANEQNDYNQTKGHINTNKLNYFTIQKHVLYSLYVYISRSTFVHVISLSAAGVLHFIARLHGGHQHHFSAILEKGKPTSSPCPPQGRVPSQRKERKAA